jgi:DNA-binding MarR family transcriptional regulator
LTNDKKANIIAYTIVVYAINCRGENIYMNYRVQESLGFLVNVTAQAMKNRFAKKLKEYDIAPEQFATLIMLQDNKNITLTEIANLLYKDKTTITRMIESLEKKGYVDKIRVDGDRRAYSVVLTEKAEDLIQKVEPIAYEVKKRHLELFSKEELEILKKSLEKLRDFEF